jgi:hypothetical protein
VPSSKRIRRSSGGGKPTIQPSFAGSLAAASRNSGGLIFLVLEVIDLLGSVIEWQSLDLFLYII